MKDELHFGYSMKFSFDGKTLDLQLRLDEHYTNRLLIESLRALADNIEREAIAGNLDKDLDA